MYVSLAHLFQGLVYAHRFGAIEPDGEIEVNTRANLMCHNCPDMIDKSTKEIKQDNDQTVYTSLDEIADDLPDHSPRFVLLSYPMTLVRSLPD